MIEVTAGSHFFHPNGGPSSHSKWIFKPAGLPCTRKALAAAAGLGIRSIWIEEDRLDNPFPQKSVSLPCCACMHATKVRLGRLQCCFEEGRGGRLAQPRNL